MKRLNNAILPGGFRASGIYCGIKKSKSKDLGLIYSDSDCASAGMFTANKVKAESLLACRQQLKKARDTGRAIIVNSGNANCFVGERGIKDALGIIQNLGRQLKISKDNIFIASTGIIGKPLPSALIKQALSKLCRNLNKSGLLSFADSILTTDTFRKVTTVRLKINNKPVLITGIAKGAGMIYPNLEKNSIHATMLVFILTDIAVKRQLLELALNEAVNNSFNGISIDGCMSTNDTVLILANGAAGNKPIVKKDRNFTLFRSSLLHVCENLSRMIVVDAEGGTKLIEILVKGAKSRKEAKVSAEAVANSSLFKSAMFGANPNWGRVVQAIGASGIVLDQNKLQISFNDIKVFDKGKAYSTDRLRNYLKHSDTIKVEVNFNKGTFQYRVLTSDLSTEYVKINAEYN